MEKVFAVIDLKSFYATVECVKRGLDPYTAPLVVCDEFRGPGSIVMSVSPYLKTKGCKNIMRRFDLPKGEKIIFAKPNMELYVTTSAYFNAHLLKYFAQEDLHPYSIDETFINLTPYLDLYKLSPKEIVVKILKEIKNDMGLLATAGIGPNMFMAKIALDIEAKHVEDNVAVWYKEDVEKKLWPITPLNKMWGIAGGYLKKLNNLGLFSVGDIAKYPKGALKDKFGIIGEQIWEHANGIDESDMSEQYVVKDKSFSSGQILHRDYKIEEIPTLIREMCDEICTRLRSYNFKCNVVSLGILETKPVNKSYGRSMSLVKASNDNDFLYEAFITLYNSFPLKHFIRQVFLAVGDVGEYETEQISLFYDGFDEIKSNQMWQAIDQIRNKFGKDKIMRLNALTSSSTYLQRINQIGGHHK